MAVGNGEKGVDELKTFTMHQRWELFSSKGTYIRRLKCFSSYKHSTYHLKCYQSEVTKMYQNMFEADKLERPYCPTIKPCWIPQISNFIPENSSGMNTCTKVEDYDCMIHVFGRIKLGVSTKCEEHCEESTYRVSKSQTPMPETSLVRKLLLIILCGCLSMHHFRHT